MLEAKLRPMWGMASLALAMTVGCGASGRAAATASKASGPTVDADAWASSSWEDRHDTMTFAVLPNLGRSFQRFYGAPSPTLTCVSCHGRTAEAVGYRMPNGLPPLDPAHMPRVDDADPSKARMAKFMLEEVTPLTADLMGTHRYDPATGKGFGCFNCHGKVDASR